MTPQLDWHPEAVVVGALLGAHGLPTDDITAAMLSDFVVATRDGEPCGVAGLQREGAVALLRSLAVVHDARGHGLGASLVAAIEARAAANDVAALYLLTTDAAPFFARLGYVPVARAEAPAAIQATAQFSSICCGSATLMRKAINASGG